MERNYALHLISSRGRRRRQSRAEDGEDEEDPPPAAAAHDSKIGGGGIRNSCWETMRSIWWTESGILMPGVKKGPCSQKW